MAINIHGRIQKCAVMIFTSPADGDRPNAMHPLQQTRLANLLPSPTRAPYQHLCASIRFQTENGQCPRAPPGFPRGEGENHAALPVSADNPTSEVAFWHGNGRCV